MWFRTLAIMFSMREAAEALKSLSSLDRFSMARFEEAAFSRIVFTDSFRFSIWMEFSMDASSCVVNRFWRSSNSSRDISGGVGTIVGGCFRVEVIVAGGGVTTERCRARSCFSWILVIQTGQLVLEAAWGPSQFAHLGSFGQGESRG